MTKASEWFRHNYFRTYRISNHVEDVAKNPMSYISDFLQNLVPEGLPVDWILPWQKESILHKFARFIADMTFYNDLNGPTLTVKDPRKYPPEWILPVDLALISYGISDKVFMGPSKPYPADAAEHYEADAYYDYFVQNLLPSAIYDNLLNTIADEVFFIVFMNRSALAALNRFAATYVGDMDFDWDAHDGEDDESLFESFGQLKRKAPPKWAKNAVFFRDRGKCVYCARDLSGLLGTFPNSNYDHVVPLARGGLNDVTNLQLLCESCNAEKADHPYEPSNRYQRWYH
ncbi:HNH endonuclease [Embleya scabrispora]|uniref:HNH endonuclease n=1 Tax=Embleya scabrispora TaxID=159449 RepID=UPI00099E9092|nr:HNH endonuclease signature motif containing protein [Embleya scabrispora]MYS86838.1 hypothetical protein [Streptomyces sp. SID5474]